MTNIPGFTASLSLIQLQMRSSITRKYQTWNTLHPAVDIEECYNRCYDECTICEYDSDGNPYNCFTRFSCLRSCRVNCNRFQ